LIADITNLFSGSSKAAPAPLSLFSLPDSIQEITYLSSNGTNLYPGDSIDRSRNSGPGSTIYTTNGLLGNASRSATTPHTDSTATAQAVKQALLSSSTLGDVIAEL
jgi:hypothetical protein